MAYDKELAFAKALAAEAGKVMQRYFRSDDINVETKHNRTLVTAADLEINRLLIERVKAAFPTHSIHGEEETAYIQDAPFTWVCDPLDGTMPFANGIPISTFSLALVDDNGTSVLGVAYDPFLDLLYEAVRGQGAFLNGKRLQVSAKDELDLAFIDLEMWYNEIEGVTFDDPRDVLAKQGAKVTTMCSAVMSGGLVANGVYEAMIFGQGKPEDIAALSVIVEEAGGKVTDLRGWPQRYDRPVYGGIVSNGKVHDALVAILDKINYKSKV